MRAVFGLGNPGRAYARTRHNVGFEIIDLYRKVHRIRKKGRIESSALLYRWDDLLLVKPMTFMNASGRAVRGVLSRHNIAPEDALVIYDDLDLPLGRLRVLSSGGSGSHNGMRSVLGALGTEAIPRLRIGIGRDERAQTGRDYVLDRFSTEDWKVVVPVLERAVEAVEAFRNEDIQAVMTRFNRRT